MYLRLIYLVTGVISLGYDRRLYDRRAVMPALREGEIHKT